MDLFIAIWQRDYEHSSYFLEQVPQHQNLRFGTQLQGGFSTASFDVVGPLDMNLLRYRGCLGSTMTIFDKWFRRAYEGQIQDVALSDEGVAIQASGFYANANEKDMDLIYQFQEGTPVTVYEVLCDAVQLMENAGIDIWNEYYAFMDSYADVDVTALGDKDYTGVKIRDVIEENLKLGYKETDGRSMYFGIWANRTPRYWKEPELVSMNMQFWDRTWMIYGHNITDFKMYRSRTQVFNKIWGVYDTEHGTMKTATAAEDKVSQGIYGIREGTLNVGSVQEAVANELRDYALEKHAYARHSFQMSLTGPIMELSGKIDTPWAIKAGDIVCLAGLDPWVSAMDYAVAQAGHGVRGLVMSTLYDDDSKVMRVEVSTKDTRFDTMLARLGIQGSLS